MLTPLKNLHIEIGVFCDIFQFYHMIKHIATEHQDLNPSLGRNRNQYIANAFESKYTY